MGTGAGEGEAKPGGLVIERAQDGGRGRVAVPCLRFLDESNEAPCSLVLLIAE